MKEKILRGIGVFLISAVTLVASAASVAPAVSAESIGCAKIALSDAEVVAGQYVEVDLSMETGNTCAGYNIGIEFDDRLELKSVKGSMASETIDNVCTVVNFTGTSFKDNEAITTLVFEVPEDAESGTVYDVAVSTITDFTAGDYTDEYESIGVDDSTITVKKEHSIKVFKIAEDAEPVVGLRGDANDDDKVDLQDAIAMANCIVGSKSFDAKQTFFADTDNNGKMDIRDVINLCRYTINTEKTWEGIIG